MSWWWDQKKVNSHEMSVVIGNKYGFPHWASLHLADCGKVPKSLPGNSTFISLKLCLLGNVFLSGPTGTTIGHWLVGHPVFQFNNITFMMYLVSSSYLAIPPVLTCCPGTMNVSTVTLLSPSQLFKKFAT